MPSVIEGIFQLCVQASYAVGLPYLAMASFINGRFFLATALFFSTVEVTVAFCTGFTTSLVFISANYNYLDKIKKAT